jgi:hypothetical protein
MIMARLRKSLGVVLFLICLLTFAQTAALAGGPRGATPASPLGDPLCEQDRGLCADNLYRRNYEGEYVGHDEPSLLFYSNRPGAGNNNVYRLTLPTDPPILPRQDGTGGTFNFQLRPAFWFGMAMCDSQSAPNPGLPCAPDTDANIFDGANPATADYIGHHPGAAFMEMQFYPPGWVGWPAGVSCDPTRWCAALNIDSFSVNMNTGVPNNANCLALTGIEPVNFAFITKNGLPHAPANPVDSTIGTFTPNPATDLFMNSGDTLTVDMHDTAHGFQVVIHDLTTGQSGSMTASAANSFGQVQYAPDSADCNNIPYDFHPMYSTSSEHTRVPWAAHSYNVAFSDEIGHFEYCADTPGGGGPCTSAGATDPGGVDADDNFCFRAAESLRIPISGCIDSDGDFDGPEYGLNWPGTFTNPGLDAQYHSRPVAFAGPVFNGGQSYSRVAFETDLPAIESTCNVFTGAGCTDPPPGATFYPIYSTRNSAGSSAPASDGLSARCLWQLGGPYIPGTKNTFGGTAAAEYGPLLSLTYPDAGGPQHYILDFRQVLSNNPCGR